MNWMALASIFIKRCTLNISLIELDDTEEPVILTHYLSTLSCVEYANRTILAGSREADGMNKHVDRRRLLAVTGALFVGTGIAAYINHLRSRSHMNHALLLGDSSLDNGAYVARGEAVIDHLQRLVSPGWKTTLLAVDGGTISGIPRQLAQLPKDVTHLVVSVGGNDALRHQGILTAQASWAAEVIGELADITEEFAASYRQMLVEVLRLQLPIVICTIYYPRFPDPTVQRLSVTASTIFNDVILREAFSMGLPVMDLRLICNEDADYANPIEPSSSGGRKIAESMIRALTLHDFTRQRTEVFL